MAGGDSTITKTTPPANKPARWRRVWKVLRWVLAAPLVLVLVVLMAAHTSPAKERLRARVEQRLQQRLRGKVTLEAVDYALFGDVTVQHLSVYDEQGKEVVGVDKLLLRPDWWALVSGQLVLDQASLNGVRVQLVAHEDGTTNLKRLLKPNPPKPPKPARQPKKKTRIVVRNLDIGPVELNYDKFDGTHIGVRQLMLGGSLDVTAGDKTAHVSLPVITSNFTLSKQQALTLALNKFKSGIELDLTAGAGTLTVARTQAKASIERQHKHDQLDIDLAGIQLDIAPGKLGATLDHLLAGALLLDALELQRTTDDKGNLVGTQKANVIGLKLDAKRLNNLLHREILRRDVRFDTSLTGPADKLVLALNVAAGTGHIDINGTIDAATTGRAGFDVALVADKLNSAELLAEGVAPDVLLDHLTVNASSGDDEVVHARVQATQLRIKQYLIDAVALEADIKNKVVTIKPLQVEAYGYSALVRGEVDLNTRRLDIIATVDGDVGVTLDKLRAAGIAIKTRLPAGKVTLEEGALTLHIHGDIDGVLHAEVKADDFRIAGGSIDADVHAQLLRNPTATGDEKKVTLQHADGTIELRHISIGQLLALRGKTLKGMSARLSGQLRLSEVPDNPKLGYRVVVQAQPHELDKLVAGEPTIKAVLHGSADLHNARVKLAIDGIRYRAGGQSAGADRPPQALLRGTIALPLFVSGAYKGIDPFRQLTVKLDMPRRAFSELLPYLPKHILIDKNTGKPRNIPSSAAAYAHVDIGGTSASPAGTVALDAFVPALGQAMQRIKLDGTLSSNTPGLAFRSDISAWLNAEKPVAITGTAHFDTDHSPLLGRMGNKTWSLDLAVKPQHINELPISAQARQQLRGTVAGSVHLDGNSDGAFNGDITINAYKLTRAGKGPFAADVALHLGDKPTTVAGTLFFAGKKRVALAGQLDMTGPDLLELAKNRPLSAFDLIRVAATDVSLDVALPRHAIASYAPLNPKLAALPGDVGGLVTVRGALGNPRINGEVSYGSFKSVAGTPGRVAVIVTGNRSNAAARLEVGSAQGGRAPLQLAATTTVEALMDYLAASRCYRRATTGEAAQEKAAECNGDARLAIDTSARASEVDIRTLVPAFVVAGHPFVAAGTLNWNLDGHLLLDPKPRYAQREGQRVKLPPLSPDSKLAGHFDIVNGLFNIPGSKRRYHDITVKLRHNLSRVSIEALSLRESDREKTNRSIDIDGALTLSALRPDVLKVSIKSRDWLVFGGSKFGHADAPRGALTMAATAKGSLTKAIKTIDVDVTQLELLVPNRFRRAHQPEVLSLGDVIFLDRSDAKPGKLPISASKRRQRQPVKSQSPKKIATAKADAARADEAASQPSHAATGLDVHVRIPKPVHLLQHPMDLYAHGKVDVQLRGGKRRVNGKLTMSDGKLALGGRQHPLQRGTIVFNDKYPGGYMNLLFGRREHNVTLRDLSEASGGNLVTIHLEGPLNARRTTLSGAGSPGTLFDLLSVHNVGRQRYLAQPDMPATVTVEYPQHMNLLLMSYLSVNAPHLLFLDRVAAWSDMYDNRATVGYGQLQHYEGVRYTDDGDVRVRAVMRPRAPGRSRAEVQLDYLFSNTRQSAFGVGVGAGSRLGGGPAIFFEWSSKD